MSLSVTPEEVWARLGHRVQATAGRVFVVTDLPAKKVGSLFLPMKATTFYGELPHLVMVRATVLSAGPKVQGLNPGDRVTFPRTYFIRWRELEPDVMLGWVDRSQISGFFNTEDEDALLQQAG
jgi:hypothetical protein